MLSGSENIDPSGSTPTTLTSGALLLEIPARSRDGSAGPHPGDEMCYAAFGLAPDLRSRRLVVGERIGRVLVLTRLEAPRDLVCQSLGDGVVALGVVWRRSRRDYYLGAHSLQQVLFLLAHLIRHHADAPVAFDRGGHGQAGSRVPARRLDDGPAGPEEPLLLGDLEHPDGRPVLYRAGGVQVLGLRKEGGLYALVTLYSAHTDQGCIPDGLEHVLEIVHPGRLPSPAPPDAFAYNPRPWNRAPGKENASQAKWNSRYTAPEEVQTLWSACTASRPSTGPSTPWRAPWKLRAASSVSTCAAVATRTNPSRDTASKRTRPTWSASSTT